LGGNRKKDVIEDGKRAGVTADRAPAAASTENKQHRERRERLERAYHRPKKYREQKMEAA